jgi:hypothetical protein
MKPQTNLAIGVLMVCVAITGPVILAYPLKLEVWWQVILFNVPFWALSWFGSARATRAYILLRAVIFALERELALEEMDARYQPKEQHENED